MRGGLRVRMAPALREPKLAKFEGLKTEPCAGEPLHPVSARSLFVSLVP